MIAPVLDYIFTPNRNEIVLKSIQIIETSRVQYIVNITRNVVLYDYSSPVSLSTDGTNILTLPLGSCAGMLHTDELNISYDFFLASNDGLTDEQLRASPVPITGSVSMSLAGLATDSNQTSGAQKTQIVDAGGEQVTVTSGRLDVNASPSGTQDINITQIGGNVVTTSLPVSATNLDIRDLTFAGDKVDVSNSTGVGVTGTFWQATQPISAVSLPLPTGAATELTLNSAATVLGNIETVISGTLSTSLDAATLIGQDIMANSLPVVLASDQSDIPVTLDTSLLATVAAQTDKSQFTKLTDGVDTALITTSGELNVIATAQPGVDVGDVTINNASGASAVNIQDGGNSITIDGTITSITDTVITKKLGAVTPSQSSPSITVASTSILSSNSGRLGATIYNEGAAICYMKLGATASITSYTLQIAVGGYYELPFSYTGAVDGITSVGTAQLRVTELT